jgi:hypothetical protein
MPVRNPRVFNPRLAWQLLAVAGAAVFLYFLTGSARQSSVAASSVTTITAVTNAIGADWWRYAASIAAVSTLSVAVVEFLKAVLDVQRWYHEARLRSWLPRSAFEQLAFLAIGDWRSLDALCAQPIEKMMGEIQPAANIALDSPDQYPELFRFLTSTDLYRSQPDGEADFAEADRRHHMARARNPPPPRAPDEPPGPEAREAAKARLRLANLVSRKLDAFQLRTEYYWNRGNQLAAIGVSVALVFFALISTGVWTVPKLAFGLVSGLTAPFMKDFATNLSRFASRS